MQLMWYDLCNNKYKGVNYIMKQTERYTMELEEGVFAKWVLWTAGLYPRALEGNLDQAMIVSDEWLQYNLERTNKTRKEMLEDTYPTIKFHKMKLTFA